MGKVVDDNPTRQHIITLLKKSGGMTIEELSGKVSITPMGIRQHLLSLEKKGLVTYSARKHGIGRPGFVYRLTDAADELFPKAYDQFAVEMLQDIKKFEGKEKLSAILTEGKERLLKKRREALSGIQGLDDTMNALRDILDAEGRLPEITKDNGNYHIKTYNCPFSRIAAAFNDVCTQELQMYRELLDRNVTMDQCIGRGDSSCLFTVPRS